jgi:hypothetical protein
MDSNAYMHWVQNFEPDNLLKLIRKTRILSVANSWVQKYVQVHNIGINLKSLAK